MARPKINPALHKTKAIKIMVTESEFKIYQSAKNRLLHSSPPLLSYDILKYCVLQLDDLALLEFLKLDKNSSIKVKLRNDYLMSRFDNKL